MLSKISFPTRQERHGNCIYWNRGLSTKENRGISRQPDLKLKL